MTDIFFTPDQILEIHHLVHERSASIIVIDKLDNICRNVESRVQQAMTSPKGCDAIAVAADYAVSLRQTFMMRDIHQPAETALVIALTYLRLNNYAIPCDDPMVLHLLDKGAREPIEFEEVLYRAFSRQALPRHSLDFGLAERPSLPLIGLGLTMHNWLPRLRSHVQEVLETCCLTAPGSEWTAYEEALEGHRQDFHERAARFIAENY